MIKKQSKKAILLVILSVIIGMTINTNYVHADGTSENTQQPPEPPGEGGFHTRDNDNDPEPGNQSPGTGGGNGAGTSCTKSGSFTTSSSNTYKYHIYRRDSDMKYALYNYNDEIISKSSPIPAGTSIGASLYEQRDYYWTQSCYTTTTTTYKYQKCTFKKRCAVDVDSGDLMCEHYWNCDKPTYCSDVTTSGRNCTSKEDEQIKNAVKSEMDKIPGSYIVTVSDPNDISCTTNPKKTGCKTYTVNSINTYNYPEKYHLTKRYNYELYGACINVKTAKVRYLTSSSGKCNEDEIKIENSTSDFYNRHWHIFIPLNTKTTDIFQFAMNGNTKISSNECKIMINDYNKNNEYLYYIKPGNNQENFTGNKNTDLKSVEKYGCYRRTIYNVPITQKFYNEEQSDDKTIFKGFAFYYRPININNPFPNGIANDSLWKEWESNNKKDPDLTKSFSSITYYATNINANSVRTYNKEHPYTSWSEMNLNGTSNYINSSSIIKRNNVSTKSFYNLGCGPSNKDWEECR